MSSAERLEAAYRRWLRCYPGWFRREHEDEMLAVLTAGAGPARRRPPTVECVDLLWGGMLLRIRPRVERADWSTLWTVRLSYLGAVMQLAVAVTVLATSDDVKARILASDPGYGAARWHALLMGGLEPLAAFAALGVLVWGWVAWLRGRGHSWAHGLLVVLVAMTTVSLLHGLAGGSRIYAPFDLAVGVVLWLVGVAAVLMPVGGELCRIAAFHAGDQRWGERLR